MLSWKVPWTLSEMLFLSENFIPGRSNLEFYAAARIF